MTPNREKAIRMYKAGKTTPEIAAALGVSKERVCQYLRFQFDLRAEREKRWREQSQATRDRLLAAFASDRTYEEIAAELGISPRSACQYANHLRNSGAPVRYRPRSRAETTDEILRRYKAGDDAVQIALDLDMRIGSVRQRLWHHLGTTRKPGATPYRKRKLAEAS